MRAFDRWRLIEISFIISLKTPAAVGSSRLASVAACLRGPNGGGTAGLVAIAILTPLKFSLDVFLTLFDFIRKP